MGGRHALLVLLLTGTLAAFGGIYAWALPFIIAGTALLCAGHLPAIAHPPQDARSLDRAIVVLVAAIVLQLIPLPSHLRVVLSPHVADLESVLSPAGALHRDGLRALSIDVVATGRALGLVVATALTYWSGRALLSRGGTRRVCRAIAAVAVVASIGAIVQRALSPTLIYGFWQPQDLGAQPFGPVVNRNHFAGWLVMASALTAGYLAARIARRTARFTHGVRSRGSVTGFPHEGHGVPSQSSFSWFTGLEDEVRSRSSRGSITGFRWLARVDVAVTTTAVCWAVVTLTIVVSQSRSAIVGVAFATAGLARTVMQTWRPVLSGVIGILIAGIALASVGEATTAGLVGRFAETLQTRDVSRIDIWRDTLPMLRDFPFSGVGIGGFERAMLVYQRTRVFAPHLGTEWHFNHAHNHYLQLAAEGGVLITVPVIAVVVMFVGLATRRLREDRSDMRYVRVGALAGLLGVAVQSLWEVPLTMPAAALLAATLAAIATCQRAPSGVAR